MCVVIEDSETHRNCNKRDEESKKDTEKKETKAKSNVKNVDK